MTSETIMAMYLGFVLLGWGSGYATCYLFNRRHIRNGKAAAVYQRCTARAVANFESRLNEMSGTNAVSRGDER